MTAGARGVANVPTADASRRVDDVRAALAGVSFDCATELAVLEDGRLVGLVPVEALLAASGETRVRNLVAGPPRTVAPGADLETAAWQAARHGSRSIALVDENDEFHGIVSPERLLAVLAEEHEEDLARLGGFLAQTSAARRASEEGVSRRLWHRLPWLALGLVGAMASAGIVASFEEQLQKEVLLAFFVPAVVYMADAVGTQTEAVVIRGMAVGARFRSVVGRELASGLVIGLLLAALFLPFALLVWGDARVAASVSLALFVSSSIATLVAMALPYLLARLGRDPAFGSGPLATVIQDLLSIVVYFAIAAALIT